MATPIFRYPLDKTGLNPDNLVVREPHQLSPKDRPTDVRVFCPLYGPFYADSNLTILDAANGRELKKDIDYKVTDLLQDPTLSFAKEIGQFIVIINGTVSNEIEVSYQVLGGNYQNDATAVQHAFETFLNDTRPVDWSNVTGRPSTFPPSLHLHLLSDIINFGPLVVAIDSLRDAKLLNNTPMFEALIDWINAKVIDWKDIVNKPTTSVGMGLTDVVTLGGIQTVTGMKTFTQIHTGVGSTAISTDTGKKEVFATSPQVVRAEARLVPRTRRIETVPLTGLMGGGNLDNDLNLYLSDSGVTAGLYGTSRKIPRISVDRYGRVTGVTPVDADLSFNNLTDKPTTLAGYGITDGVNKSTRVIAGNGLTGGGDLSANRTLGLADSGVSAGAYGTSRKIPVISVDRYGRVTNASSVDADLNFNNLTNKPTTLGGYGITNAVVNTTQVIAGNGLTGGGALSANRTLTLGTPLTLSATSTNRVTATGHEHEVDVRTLVTMVVPTVTRNVTGSRSLGVTYYNTTESFMVVYITTNQTSGGTHIYPYVDGVPLQYAVEDHDKGGGRSNATFFVPPGSSYSVSASGIMLWVEQRMY